MTFFGLKKTDKLLKRSAYLHLSKQGRSVSDRYFIIAFLPNALDRNRLGITITKRVGNAVVRNRLKRIAREFFRLNRQSIKGHWDINIIAKQPAANLSSEEMTVSLRRLASKIKEARY